MWYTVINNFSTFFACALISTLIGSWFLMFFKYESLLEKLYFGTIKVKESDERHLLLGAHSVTAIAFSIALYTDIASPSGTNFKYCSQLLIHISTVVFVVFGLALLLSYIRDNLQGK